MQIIGEGESPYQVTAGDLVDFVDFAGTVAAHDATFATTVGLLETDGATQLTTQAAPVEVTQGGVTLSQACLPGPAGAVRPPPPGQGRREGLP